MVLTELHTALIIGANDLLVHVAYCINGKKIQIKNPQSLQTFSFMILFLNYHTSLKQIFPPLLFELPTISLKLLSKLQLSAVTVSQAYRIITNYKGRLQLEWRTGRWLLNENERKDIFCFLLMT